MNLKGEIKEVIQDQMKIIKMNLEGKVIRNQMKINEKEKLILTNLNQYYFPHNIKEIHQILKFLL